MLGHPLREGGVWPGLPRISVGTAVSSFGIWSESVPPEAGPVWPASHLLHHDSHWSLCSFWT